jgi:hypothetical protein
MTDLVMRPLSAGEEPLFGSLADPGLVRLARVRRPLQRHGRPWRVPP